MGWIFLPIALLPRSFSSLAARIGGRCGSIFEERKRRSDTHRLPGKDKEQP